MRTSVQAEQRKTSDLGMTDSDARRLYRLLLTARRVDERGRTLYKQGRFPGNFFSGVGQEVTDIAPTFQLRAEDYIGPSHRDTAAAVGKGVPLRLIFAQLYGRSTSPDRGRTTPCHLGYQPLNVVTPASTIGAQWLMATGAALGFQLQKKDHIAVAFCGDGATSHGHFHEACNFAGSRRLPIVYIVQNNLWAESVPLSIQTGITNLSDRAKSYGFPGVTVDGNEVKAVFEASRKAIARARSGDGPTLIECKTYRWYGHSEIDPATYRTREELEEWKAKDPVPRFERLLVDMGVLQANEPAEILAEIEKEIDEAVEFAEQSTPVRPEEALDHVYSDLRARRDGGYEPLG